MTDLIRPATPADFDRINEIYNWTIVDNHVSFDTEPFDHTSRARWWGARAPALTFLVSELDGVVTGLAYSSWYRPKRAYRSTVETTWDRKVSPREMCVLVYWAPLTWLSSSSR